MLTKTLLFNWVPYLLLFFIRNSRLQITSDVFRLICPGDSHVVAPRLSETVLATFHRHDFEFESYYPIRGLYQQLPSHLSGPEFRSNLTKGQHLFEFKAVDSIGRSAICVFTLTVEVISCPNFLSLTLGEISCNSKSHIFGTKCSLICPKGYASQGQPIECLESGLWHGHLLHCHTITCPDPGIPIHGNRHCSNRYFVYDSSCGFSCQHGFQLVGNRDVVCLTANEFDDIGEWTNPAPICQKIIPPIIEECPSDVVHIITSRSEAEVAIPEIVFRSSVTGTILNYTCNDLNLSESHYLFPVGFHYINCFASEPSEPISDKSFISECNFTIHVEADPCQPLPQPINGFLFCSRVPHFNKSQELGLLLAMAKDDKSKFIKHHHHHHHQLRHSHHHHSTTCRMFCRSGFVFPKTFGRYLESRDYKCSRHEGIWRPFSFVPGCVLPKAPSELKLPVEIQFNIVRGDCSMLTTVSQSLLQSQLKSTSICSRNQKECLVEEWSVACQRLDVSGGLESSRRRKRKKRNFGRNTTQTNANVSESNISKDRSNPRAAKPNFKKSQSQRKRQTLQHHSTYSRGVKSSDGFNKTTSKNIIANKGNYKHRRLRHNKNNTLAMSFPKNATTLPFRTRPKARTSISSLEITSSLPSSTSPDRRGPNASASNMFPSLTTSSALFIGNQSKDYLSKRTKGNHKREAVASMVTSNDDKVTNRMLVRFQLATRLRNGVSETETSPKKWASDYHRTVVFLQSMYHALEELLANGNLNILQIVNANSKGKELDLSKNKESKTISSVVGYAVTAQADIIPVCDFEYEFNKDYLICVPCGPNTFYDTSTGQCGPCPEGTSQPDQAQFTCN